MNLSAKIKNKLSNPVNVIGVAIAFLGAFSCIPNQFAFDVYPIGIVNYLGDSLDPSWSLAMNYFSFKNLTWGEDVVFTYGPLCYLATRVGVNISKYPLILFDFFYFINFFFLNFYSYKRAQNKIIALFLILSAVALIPLFIGGASSLVFFIFLIFWIRMSIDEPSIKFYVIQVMILLLLFFLKFNTGLISFVAFYGQLLYLFISKKETKKMLLTLALAPLGLICFLSTSLNVNVVKYVSSGLQIVDGFNQTMGLTDIRLQDLHKLALYFGIVLVLFLLLAVYNKQKAVLLKNIFVLGLFFLCLFVIYKQSFVRGDLGHALDFFRYPLLLVLAIQSFLQFKIFNYKNLLLICIIIIPFFAESSQKIDVLADLSNKLNKSEYFNGLIHHNAASANHLLPNQNNLPASIKDKIGSASIDVFPWNIHLLFENELNYKPRPVLQSYSAYTKKLEELNFNYYNSNKRPQFVLLDYGSIDNRYPLFDEPKTTLALKQHYNVVDTLYHNKRSMMLLEKKLNSNALKFELIKEYAMQVGSPITPEQNIYYEFELYPTLKEKIYSTLYKPSDVSLKIQTSRSSKEFKTSTSLLKNGLFCTRFINNTKQLHDEFANQSIAENDVITSYTIIPFDPSCYKNKIRIKEYKITQ